MFLATAPAEPFGLAVVEAMTHGLPVLAADGGAHRELLDAFTDQLFTPGDPATCAAALRRIACDAGLREEMARRGRARYEERYTIERHVDRLLDVYEGACALVTRP